MIKLPKLNIIRIPLGMLLVLIGASIALIQHIVPYIIGGVLCSMGAWMFSKHLNKWFRGGLMWLFMGLPLFLFSLMPHSFNWLSNFGFDGMVIHISRFLGVFIGAICFLMVYETE